MWWLLSNTVSEYPDIYIYVCCVCGDLYLGFVGVCLFVHPVCFSVFSWCYLSIYSSWPTSVFRLVYIHHETRKRWQSTALSILIDIVLIVPLLFHFIAGVGFISNSSVLIRIIVGSTDLLVPVRSCRRSPMSRFLLHHHHWTVGRSDACRAVASTGAAALHTRHRTTTCASVVCLHLTPVHFHVSDLSSVDIFLISSSLVQPRF